MAHSSFRALRDEESGIAPYSTRHSGAVLPASPFDSDAEASHWASGRGASASASASGRRSSDGSAASEGSVGEEDPHGVRERFRVLQERVKQRRQQSHALLYFSLLAHAAAAGWAFFTALAPSSASPDGGSCSRPFRGVLLASGGLCLASAAAQGVVAWTLAGVKRRFLSSASSVVRERFEDECSDAEEAQASMEAASLLAPPLREKIVSRALTDGMMHACFALSLLLLFTLALLALALMLLSWSVAWPSADCVAAQPTQHERTAHIVTPALAVLLLLHVAFYVHLRLDVTLCVRIHFVEQAMIKHDGAIRA